MRQLRMVRVAQNEQGAVGVLLIDGKIQCFTLEPDNKDEHPQIPAGQYKCRRFHGAKWKDTFEILVPGHSAVLFHIGNTEDDSQMCVLLGNHAGILKDKTAVMESTPAFYAFMKELDAEKELSLMIQEEYA